MKRFATNRAQAGCVRDAASALDDGHAAAVDDWHATLTYADATKAR
jgi:hypothetical protein